MVTFSGEVLQAGHFPDHAINAPYGVRAASKVRVVNRRVGKIKCHYANVKHGNGSRHRGNYACGPIRRVLFRSVVVLVEFCFFFYPTYFGYVSARAPLLFGFGRTAHSLSIMFNSGGRFAMCLPTFPIAFTLSTGQVRSNFSPLGTGIRSSTWI